MALKHEPNDDAEPLGEPPSFTTKPEEQVERSMNLPTRLRRFFKLPVSCQSGFSLAEVMIAVGVSGTLALGTMQLAGLQSKTQMTDELMGAQLAADMIIKNKQACTSSLNGLPIAIATPVPIPNGLAKANSTEGDVSINKCQANGTNCGLRISPRAADITEAKINLINKTEDWVVFGNNVMVKDIALTQFREIRGEKAEERAAEQAGSGTGATRVNAGIAEVRITFAVKDRSRAVGGGAVELRTVQKYILTPVSVGPTGLIESCEIPDDQAILEADYELCESLGGVYENNKCNNGTENLTELAGRRLCDRVNGSYNNANGSCVPPWYGCLCPAGQFVIGFDPDSNKPRCSGGALCTP